MSDAVTLLVPVEESYRALAAELARKYLEIAGGSSQDAEALAAALSIALAQIARGAAAEAEVAIAFARERASVDVDVRCGGQSQSFSQPILVQKS